MPVTLEQLAADTGVSTMTVSRALRGTGRMAEATRKRIVETATARGYRPNAGARATRSGKHYAVALLLSADAVARSMVSPNALRGLDERLGEAGYHVTLAHVRDASMDQRVPKLLSEYLADAVIVAYAEQMPDTLSTYLGGASQPTSWLNVKREHDAVYPDDQRAGYDATRHLIEAGHRDIAYYDPSHDYKSPHNHYSVTDRLAGYRAAMAEASYRCQEWTEQIPGQDRVSALAANLKRPQRPTALVSYGESQPVFMAAMQLGLTMPHDLSFVTFYLAPIAGPGFTVDTWIVPQTSLGQAAAESVLGRIENPKQPHASIALPFRHHPGRSVRPIVSA